MTCYRRFVQEVLHLSKDIPLAVILKDVRGGMDPEDACVRHGMRLEYLSPVHSEYIKDVYARYLSGNIA